MAADGLPLLPLPLLLILLHLPPPPLPPTLPPTLPLPLLLLPPSQWLAWHGMRPISRCGVEHDADSGGAMLRRCMCAHAHAGCVCPHMLCTHGKLASHASAHLCLRKASLSCCRAEHARRQQRGSELEDTDGVVQLWIPAGWLDGLGSRHSSNNCKTCADVD